MKLILTYTLIAGVISALTAPIPGTSLLLTGLEIYMIVHLAKVHEYKLGFKEIGYTAITIYGLSTLLKDTALEILTSDPRHWMGIRGDRGNAFCFLFGNAG